MSNPKDNVTPIREDGPALQKLFAMIEEPVSFRSEVPVEMDLAKRVQAMDENPEALASSGDPVIEGSADPVEGPSPMQYGKKLHEAGEAATSILKEMCAAEFAMGNPRNMPEPVLGWYGMTLAYQLCVLESCNHDADARLMEAKQLRAAVNAIKRCEPRYAKAVMDEIEDTINGDRVRIMATLLPGADLSYGGELTW